MTGKSYTTFILTIFALALESNSGCAQSANDGATAQSKSNAIVKVTLYRQQALITRQIQIDGGPSEQEISLGRLPDQVVTNSLFAESDSNVLVHGVRIGQQLNVANNDGNVGLWRSEMAELESKIAEQQHKISINAKQRDYIDAVMKFSADKSGQDLNRGVLNAESVTQLSQFSMDSQKKLLEELFQLERELKSLSDRLLQRQRQMEMVSTGGPVAHEATITASSAKGGTIFVSYLVTGCGWEPTYTIYGNIGQDQFKVRYTAQIQQLTGEDWSQVALTLSTASPGISSTGPALTPFRLTAVRANKVAQPGNTVPTQSMQALLEKQNQVANHYAGGFEEQDNLNRDLALNELANEYQNLELQADAMQMKTLALDAGADLSSQTYEIAKPVSLHSRRDNHSVLIFESTLPGRLYHLATPLLSSFSFREAELQNKRAEGLLGGPATVYLDGKFVGRTDLPSTASGQRVIVGFGADPQVRTRRELITKSEEIQGGNKRITFSYRLVVANFKDTPIEMRLLDRLPLVGQGTDLRIDLNPANPPISQDGMFARIQKPRGILRWDIQVGAEQFGEQAYDLDYSYSIAFDRTMQLSANSDAASQIEQDLFESAAPSTLPMGMGGMGGGMGGMGGMGGRFGN